jgi:copper transport protein
MIRAARALVAVAALLMAGHVWPHASLVESQPPDGAQLASAPVRLVLRFDEPVTPLELRLLDAQGRERLERRPAVSGNELAVDLPALSGGDYWVSWRVISADAHPIGGALAFRIGQATPGMQVEPQQHAQSVAPPNQLAGAPGVDGGWDMTLMVVRLMLYLALVQAAGGALFRALVGLHAGRVPEETLESWTRLVRVAACLTVVCATVSVGLKGAQLVAGPWAVLLEWKTWMGGLATSLGLSMAGVGTAALGIALLAQRTRVCAVAGVVALGSLCLTGHGAAGPLWMQLATGVHALMAGFWLGSLAPLLMLIRADAALRLAALQRFSRLALPAVALLFASGVVVALGRVDPATLLESRYGQLLSIKAGAALLLLTLAALNRLRATPALVRGAPGAGAALSRNIRVELAAAMVLLAVTAVLVHTPPHVKVAGPQPVFATGQWRGEHSQQAGLRVAMTVSPARPGVNALDLVVQDADGRPFAPLAVSASFGHAALGAQMLQRALTPTGAGRFRLEQVPLPVPGSWSVGITVLIDDFSAADFEFQVQLR